MSNQKALDMEVLPSLDVSTAPQDFQLKLQASFAESYKTLQTLVTRSREIRNQEESPEQEAEARKTRLALVKCRTGAEKVHKEMKQDILVLGRAIDGAKNMLIAATLPEEKALAEIEERAERREAERIAKLHEERLAELQPYTDAYNSLPLGNMFDEQYASILDNAKLAYEARIARERAAEEARIAAEKAAEQERQRIEAERIEAERKAAEERAALKEKLEAEEKERMRVAAEAAKEKARLEAALEAEKAKAEAEKKEAERLAKIEEEKAAKLLAEERAKAAKLQAEMQEQKAREAKAEADRIAAEKKAALAPDKEQIAAYATSLKELTIPTLKTNEGKAAAVKVARVVESALAQIRSIYSELK